MDPRIDTEKLRRTPNLISENPSEITPVNSKYAEAAQTLNKAQAKTQAPASSSAKPRHGEGVASTVNGQAQDTKSEAIQAEGTTP
ncbi:hypothetical protein BZG36_03354 [Bifiguratus adelaidae]|uniref:Uncharacterized protein n=1 Tax=Bifiguratus adelaidae TaxID=1938954 RepID=A0A261XWN1_9FUNG|nr:hypothetical protein BZG36_03354 [Bifiguratus adelaidae]